MDWIDRNNVRIDDDAFFVVLVNNIKCKEHTHTHGQCLSEKPLRRLATSLQTMYLSLPREYWEQRLMLGDYGV